MKGFLGVLKETVSHFAADDCPRLAAALAYYTVFSLPPLLIVVIAVTGLFVDPEEVQQVIVTETRQLVGPQGGEQIRTMIQQAERPKVGGVFTSVIGLAALLFGATGAFVQLQGALNAAWAVEPRTGGVKGFLLKRLFSFAMVLVLGFLLLVSLAVTAFIAGFGDAVTAVLPEAFDRYTAFLIPLLLDLTVITFLFAAIFKVVPDAKVGWRDVWVGAVFTALLFIIGKFAIGYYIGQSDPGTSYGAAGSLALVLLWVYYAALIILLGAEFTQVWARYRGKPIRPSPGAVRVRKERLEEPSSG